MDQDARIPHINEGTLQRIVVAEYPKIYLTKEVDVENKEGYFHGYNRICDILTMIALQINPEYKFPHSLFSTLFLLHKASSSLLNIYRVCRMLKPVVRTL